MTDQLSLAGPTVSFPRASAERLRHALKVMRDDAYESWREASTSIAEVAGKHEADEYTLLIECLDRQLSER